jgi:anti-anti-sigma regulatory factor
MLRITFIDTDSEEKWVLQGRLIGPWAAELLSNWKKAHHENQHRECVVDLSQVTFIDANGEKVLTKMILGGARCVVSGLYATHVVKNLENRCKGRNGK